MCLRVLFRKICAALMRRAAYQSSRCARAGRDNAIVQRAAGLDEYD